MTLTKSEQDEITRRFAHRKHRGEDYRDELKMFFYHIEVGLERYMDKDDQNFLGSIFRFEQENEH